VTEARAVVVVKIAASSIGEYIFEHCGVTVGESRFDSIEGRTGSLFDKMIN